jgi:hypothetical protein
MDVLRKTTQTIRITSLSAEIRRRYFPNTSAHYLQGRAELHVFDSDLSDKIRCDDIRAQMNKNLNEIVEEQRKIWCAHTGGQYNYDVNNQIETPQKKKSGTTKERWEDQLEL